VVENVQDIEETDVSSYL